MTVKVRIPTPLRGLTQDKDVVPGAEGTLALCIDGLETAFPGLKDRICDDTGELRRFVNVYINGEDVRFMDGLASALKEGDEVSIVPAVAGGSLHDS
jgi:molybdopterin synthase sulfur carrier subunit